MVKGVKRARGCKCMLLY